MNIPKYGSGKERSLCEAQLIAPALYQVLPHSLGRDAWKEVN